MSSLDRFAQAKLDDLQRQHLRRALTETLREDGIRKVLAGLTTPDEVIRATVGDDA